MLQRERERERERDVLIVLFSRQSYHIKLLLEFLIGVVDTKLLKRVVLEDLETINIQDPNERL